MLSPDGISSSAYGTEEILIALLPIAGLAAFWLILPMTLGILLVMTLVVLSYREVVMVYIRPGGSYVVARENFGPRIAQVCAVALLIDYVVTVAVQIAAGTAAVASAFPAIGPYKLEICVGVVLLMCYGNLRGIKEAGKAFAVPDLPVRRLGDPDDRGRPDPRGLRQPARHRPAHAARHLRHRAGYPGNPHRRDDLHAAEGVRQRRRVADRHRGGQRRRGRRSSPPEGRNARKVLVTEAIILGVLVAGIGWLAHATHATPYLSGYPTVLAQEAQIVFGSTFAGHAMFYLVQLATMLILYTGGNTSFNGFPFLTSYVAGRLVPAPASSSSAGTGWSFSNAIILLAVTSVALLIIKDADVNSLVPLYAIGVFTAFTMAGFGMAKYHHTRREPGWRHKFAINFAAGVAVGDRRRDLRDREVHRGRLGRARPVRRLRSRADQAERASTAPRPRRSTRSRGEQPPPAPHYTRRVVYVFVDSFDLATLAALRYARSLRPTQVRAVHFVIDSLRAEKLRDKWTRADRGVALDFIDCPDRR